MTFQRNLDYIDVATRLTEMREKYPDLTMTQVSMEFVSVGQKDYVVYVAAAHRNAEDTLPGIGTAWEPIPGPTSFTKDSEVQNAETAAWGRALIAIGASTRNGIATTEEITNRSGPRQSTGEENASRGGEQYRRPPREVQTPQGEEVDARIAVILEAAELGESDFLTDLGMKYTQYGNLTEKQLEAGFRTAHKILGNA
jgi:hypothetical protein